MMFKNTLQPIWLGGVPRKYVRVTGLVTPQRLRELGKLVEEGKLKVPIDSCWEMQDAQKVSSHPGESVREAINFDMAP